jgi:hypothetical protein
MEERNYLRNGPLPQSLPEPTPQPISPEHPTVTQMRLVNATQEIAVATLTAAIIASRANPTTAGKALELATDIRYSLFPPASRDGRYLKWLETKEERLNLFHS